MNPKGTRNNCHLTSVSDVLQGLLENGKSALSDGFTRWRLEQAWPQVVGEMISKQSAPCAYNRGILWIWVSHSAWVQQLWYFQDTIREKVNSHLGRQWAQEIRFTVDPRACKQNQATTTDGGDGSSE